MARVEESAAPEQLEVEQADMGRFAAPKLSPVEVTPSRGVLRKRTTGRPKRVLTVFDRGLFLTEVLCALVLAWLVGQYLYTVYFNAPPKRTITPYSAGASKDGGSALAGLTPTATRFAQLLPPMEGEPPAGSELPAQDPGTLEEWLTSKTPVPAITPVPTVDPQLLLPSRLRIPVMFLDSEVQQVSVNMGEWEVAPMDVGHHEGTGNPGQTGNVVLAGHRDINSALFRELDRLQPGDEIFVSNALGEYRYIVKESFVVGPENVEVMDPTNDKRVTLITCTPIGLATQRLVVTAILDESE